MDLQGGGGRGAGCSHPGVGPTEHRGGQDADEFRRGHAEGQVEG